MAYVRKRSDKYIATRLRIEHGKVAVRQLKLIVLGQLAVSLDALTQVQLIKRGRFIWAGLASRH